MDIVNSIIVVKSPSEITGPFDYIVFAHKAIDQEAVASQLQSVKASTLVIIQNGVGNEDPFRRTHPDSSIVTCVVRILLHQAHSR